VIRRALTLLVLVVAVAGCAGPKPQFKAQPEKASEINMELAIDYYRKGKLAEAKEKIDRAIEQNPRNAKALALAGLLYDRLNEAKKADAYFERAMAVDNKDPEILNNYATYLCQNKRFERGEKLALQAAADPLYRTPDSAYVNAGNCARGRGDLQAAEDSYRKALARKPRSTEALYQMTDLEFRNKHYLQARAFLERFVETRQTNASSLWLGWRIERALGNPGAMKTYSQRLKSEYPQSAETKELVEAEKSVEKNSG
jgi:type IV pilus assembly protein PilF